MPFQKGHQINKGGNGGMRSTFTSELIQQLEEVLHYEKPLTKKQHTFKQRICRKSCSTLKHMGMWQHAFSER